jgi:biopolymer transport protein TolR
MITLPKRSRANIDANINIVPYIDVMLVLLVIFMMGST